MGPDDVAIVLSKSGESQDLFGLVGSLQRLNVPIIAITGDMDSLLARVAAVALDGTVERRRVPTTSLQPPARQLRWRWETP